MVPARHDWVFTATETTANDGDHIFLPHWPTVVNSRLSLCHALVSSRDNSVSLCACNISTRSRYFNKGALLGTLEPCDEQRNSVNVCHAITAKQYDHFATNDVAFEEIVSTLAINPDLTPDQRTHLLAVLRKHEYIFPTDEMPYGNVPNVSHSINTSNARPFRQSPRRSDWTGRKLVLEEVDNLLQKGIVRHSDSPWSSRIRLTEKKRRKRPFLHRSQRFECFNYKKNPVIHSLLSKTS